MKVRPHGGGWPGTVRRWMMQGAAARHMIWREQRNINSRRGRSYESDMSQRSWGIYWSQCWRVEQSSLPLSFRYKIMELICYTVMGVFPALVILSMVSKVILTHPRSLKESSLALLSLHFYYHFNSVLFNLFSNYGTFITLKKNPIPHHKPKRM